jgi:uncharacterized protein YciW
MLAFTENEIKDVLTALYQDGHVDLVLADRVAAFLYGRRLRAAAVDPPPAQRCQERWANYNQCVRPFGHSESHLTEAGADWKAND